MSKLLEEIYSNGGEIDSLVKMLSFHPDFLKIFMNSYNYLMYSQGALSYDSRHFIAIMAASRHKCIYLVKLQEKEFLSQNGQKKWLLGIDSNYVPQKLKDLSELNKLLCHQPWLINRTHIEKMLKGKFSWSLTELIMAITIFSKFHALSGFVFGCGINENFIKQLQFEENVKKAEQALAEAKAAENAKAAANAKKENIEYEDDEESDLSEDEENFFEYKIENDSFDGMEFSESLNTKSTTSTSLQNKSKLDEMKLNGTFRTRSDSTGTSNRTLSNSSASSCESAIGIDMLLKEMQMMQSDDKHIQSDTISSSTNSFQKTVPTVKSSSTSSMKITRNNVSLENTNTSNYVLSTSLSSHFSSKLFSFFCYHCTFF